MPRYNQDWEDLGRSIQDVVDRAVNSRDYQQLNQNIRQVLDKAVSAGSEAVRKAVTNTSFPGTQKTASWQQPEPEMPKPLPVLYGSTGPKTAKGIAKIVGGSLASAVSLSLTMLSLVLLISGYGLFPLAASAIGLGTGIWLLCSGIGNLGTVNRFRTYCKTLGQKTFCTLEKLARSVGRSEKFVRKELQKMIDEGFFLQGHMDKEKTRLITSDETYRQFEQSRLMLEARQRQEAAAKAQKPVVTHTPQVQEVLDRGDAFIAEIRRCNDAIPGEEISGKISRMELIVQRIFDRAETNPEVVPDLKKLMDYYLPMTVKLLNAYADMDAQPVQGETIRKSKREIEDTLDTLNLAFEKLLDSIFQDTAMDVSSDISVLNTLLAQEGLTEDDLTKMRKQQTMQ